MEAATILTIVLSLEKNFAGLNQFLFAYLPFFNKFRAPSSILSITALFIPILGILGLSQILNGETNRADGLKALKIAAGVVGGIALLLGLVGPSMFDFSAAADAGLQQGGWSVDAIKADRASLLQSDGLRSFALIAISAGLIWAFLTDKIKQLPFIIGLGLLMIFDMWGVGKRYLDSEVFVSKAQYESNYTPRPVDQQIFQAEGIIPVNKSLENTAINPNYRSLENIRKRGNYRVLDMSIPTFESSRTSYFHNTIGGYSPAKMQRIQDVINKHITRGNQSVLHMLNAKYFINPQQQLQQNPNALSPAWFVESIRKVNTPNEEIDALSAFVPANEAIVLDGEFNNYIGTFDPQKNGQINLVDYKPNHLTYSTNATSEQLAVFSEVWYGPDKGWQAYIDEQPVDHIRANYLLRAMKIPSGQHTVEFKFEPKTFATTNTISLISSILLILSLLGFIGWKLKDAKESGAFEEVASSVEKKRAVVAKKVKAKPTVSKRKKKRK